MKKIFMLSCGVLIAFAVNSQNNPPVAVDDFAETRSGYLIWIFPLENDIKNSADTLILMNYIESKKGLMIEKTDSTFSYIPYFNSSGIDTVKYTISDKHNNFLMAEGLIYVHIIDQHFYDSLEINNINAGVNANGMLFSNIKEIPGQGNSGEMDSHFRFPKGGMKNTIFTNSLWVGGMDPEDSLHLAAERFKQFGIDYQAGPVSDNYDTNHYLKYGRTWKISATEVEYHKNNFWKTGYQPPEAITSWPGNGDPSKGEALQLAPYGDFNQDGIYNPSDGDYPLIRGDQTIFFMFNDDLVHTESQGERMRIEVHGMVYGFNKPLDSALYNTILVHYDLINRSEMIYSETYAGIYSDFDIGYGWDDFVGCDVARGSYYAYNGVEIDGNGEPEAYGENPPAQSVTVLAGSFIDPDGYDNPSFTGDCNMLGQGPNFEVDQLAINGVNFGNGIVDDERMGLRKFMYLNNTSPNPATTEPQTADQYYSFLKGLWKDQSSPYYGGTAHYSDPDAVGPVCDFMFPVDSDPCNWGSRFMPPNGGYNQNGKFWTEGECDNQPGDRRGLGIMGPFTFEPGDVQEIELAYCAANGWDGPLSSVDQLLENIDSLLLAVKEGKIILPNNELVINESKTENIPLIISPNPSISVINIDFRLNGPAYADYKIYDLPGALRLSGIFDPRAELKINISQLNPGFYLIILKTDQGIYSGKFIKL
jgi:hypothetical protein